MPVRAESEAIGELDTAIYALDRAGLRIQAIDAAVVFELAIFGIRNAVGSEIFEFHA
ncbi:hypothetical protein D3C83_321360 [compost metagenome]